MARRTKTLHPVTERDIADLGRDFGLYNGSCVDLLAGMADGGAGVTLIHADPPWEYENFTAAKHGAAAAYFDGLPMETIRDHMIAAYRVAAPNAYLAVWGTMPHILAWASLHTVRRTGGRPEVWLGDPETGDAWRHLSGGVWAKIGDLGAGYHFRSDAEFVILYAKGAPRARIHASNLWLERRRGHSHKSLAALRTLVEMGSGRGGTVVDLYAGDSGDLARICRQLERRYAGAEIDPARYLAACLQLGQGELPGMNTFHIRPRREKIEAPLLPGFSDPSDIPSLEAVI